MTTQHESAAPPARILIVDDERALRDALCRWFVKDGFQAQAVGTPEAAIEAMRAARFDVALLDLRLPGMDGMELHQHLRELAPQLIVIMITAYASIDTAVRAVKQGAFDYITKPVIPEELSQAVRRALDQRRLADENVLLRSTIDNLVPPHEIVGDSPAMRHVLEMISHVAKTDATVLVLGESGTGKELVARAIHAASKRHYAPIVAVNCGALPETLLESELFGHEKGAFTGASYARKGKIVAAAGGTLFLDEVGAITPKMQVDLLRVLESKELTPLGAARPVSVDFRVICATNDNLEQAVREGRFREDFYYRIKVFTIELPPLRQRRGDIPALAAHFVARFSRQMDSRITQISPEAQDLLSAYDWPGNVRELSNAIERAMVVGTPPAIRPEDLPLRSGQSVELAADQSLADVERQHIAAVLERTGGNVSRAAEILKVDRVTVYNKIRKYGLRP